MKTRIMSLILASFIAQSMLAQLTSLGLIEESSIANAESDGIKAGHLQFIPQLSFVGSRLYVATPNGLFQYEHAEWEKSSLTSDLVVEFEVRGDTLLLLTRNELIFSMDGGKTAKTIYSTETDGGGESYVLEGMAVHPHNANHIFVSTGANLLCTYNAGDEWNVIDKVHLTKLYFNPFNPNNVIGFYNNKLLSGSGIYFSRDGGLQWNSSSGYIHQGGNISELYDIAFHPTHHQSSIACGIGVYAQSDDSGATWTSICHPTTKEPIVDLTNIVYDPRNSDVIYGADMRTCNDGTTSILRSIDGGKSWATFFSAKVAEKAHVLSLSMRDNVLALYTYGNGIYLLDVDAVDTSIPTIENETSAALYYDLQGRPVANPTRGLYIKDGKKVIIGQ